MSYTPQTTTVETLKSLGVSENTAVLIQGGIDMGGSLAGSARQLAVANSKVYYAAPPAMNSLESAGANYNYTFGKSVSRMDSQTWGVAEVTTPHATYNANELTQGMRTTASQGNNVNIPRLTNNYGRAGYATEVSNDAARSTIHPYSKDVIKADKIPESPNYYTASEFAKKRSIEGINEPVHKVNIPNKRRYADKVIQGKSTAKLKNTVINRKIVNVQEDVAAIRSGKAVKKGEDFIVNGRIYEAHGNGTLFPKSGPGLYELDRGGYQALGILNKFGNTKNHLK